MHDGRFATLEQVVEHYLHPPPAPARGASHELTPIDLTPDEAASLVDFMRTLEGGIAADARWLQPPRGTPTKTLK